MTRGADTFPMGNGHNGINARLYNQRGWELTSDFQVNTTGSTSLFEPVVTALSNGDSSSAGPTGAETT